MIQNMMPLYYQTVKEKKKNEKEKSKIRRYENERKINAKLYTPLENHRSKMGCACYRTSNELMLDELSRLQM